VHVDSVLRCTFITTYIVDIAVLRYEDNGLVYVYIMDF